MVALFGWVVFSGVNLYAGGMKTEKMGSAAVGMPQADAAALWAFIHSVSPYWNWAQWPGKSGLYKGREPHGALLQTFVNPKAQRGVYGRTGRVPDEGIIVKENYMPGRRLAAITVMYKVRGYNPSDGDWFWVKYAPDGKVLKAGRPKGCIGCHGAKKDNDYLMTSDIR